MYSHQLKLKKPLAVIDLETTGVNISKDRIVELSIVKANLDGSITIRTKKVNPLIPIPLESSLIHGIYDKDVEHEQTFKQMAKLLSQFLEGCDLAGFNSNRFDIPMLVEEFLRVDSDIFDLKNRRFVDVQRIFHLMEPRTLSAAYRYYCNEELVNAHSAEADTLATLKVLDAQIVKYEGVKIKNHTGELIEPIKNDIGVLHELSSGNLVDFAQRMIKNTHGEVVFNFGKFSGQKVLDVLKREPQYYDWIINNDFPLDTKRRLTEIKLSMLSK